VRGIAAIDAIQRISFYSWRSFTNTD